MQEDKIEVETIQTNPELNTSPVNPADIDPEKVYSLYKAWRNGWIGVRQFTTARKYVYEDLLQEQPILKATIVGEGRRRSINLLGENIIEYLKMNGRVAQ